MLFRSERIIPALESLNDRCGLLVLVTNDIFSDGVVYPDMTQEYIRLLSRVNRAAAMMADQVIEVVYSIPLYIKGGTSCV